MKRRTCFLALLLLCMICACDSKNNTDSAAKPDSSKSSGNFSEEITMKDPGGVPIIEMPSGKQIN